MGKRQYSIPAPFGSLQVTILEAPRAVLGGITLSTKRAKKESGALPRSHQRILTELIRYLGGKLKSFSIPYTLPRSATIHQKKVWQAILKIPYGATASYGDLALLCASSPRAVGNACGANQLPLVIPCHRVVAKHGLGGFSGGETESVEAEASIAIKRHLLNLEGGSW